MSKRILLTVFSICFIFGLCVSSSIVIFKKYRTTQAELENIKKNPADASKNEAQKLLEKLGRHIELPQGEDPTIATISDKNQLENQPFFQKAKNGDKVIIYTQNKKVILYDPIADKIIDVAPLNIPAPTPELVIEEPTPKPTPRPTPKATTLPSPTP